MTSTGKSALILAATLLLGVALGVVGGGAAQRARRERLGALGRPRGFAAHMEEVIRPRDDAQRAAIQPVLERAGQRNRAVIDAANHGLRAALDTMRAELAPLLDDGQRARLDSVTRRLPPLGAPGPGGPPPGGRRGPPPGGPPPPDGAP